MFLDLFRVESLTVDDLMSIMPSGESVIPTAVMRGIIKKTLHIITDTDELQNLIDMLSSANPGNKFLKFAVHFASRIP